MAFNPLDCGKNKLQLDLDAADKLLAEKKAALKNAVDEAGDAYTTALSDLKTAATDKLSALNLTVPEIPKIPNFQEEIDKLISGFENPTILQDLDKLKESWKDIIPLETIEGLVVTPCIAPISFAFIISEIFAVSAKRCFINLQ